MPAPASAPGRRPAAALAAALALAIALLAGGSLATAQQAPARIAATIQILADGEGPWEDRPFAIDSGEILTGTPGVADPGDDLGPSDGVVRTYDVVEYRIAYDVLDAAARDLAIVLELPDVLRLTYQEVSRLSREGCPGGAQIDGMGRLVCRIGDIPLQTSITGHVDVSLRVRGSAPDGVRFAVAANVTAVNGRPDPDRCIQGMAGGCRARSADVRVSAALALETAIDVGNSDVNVKRAFHRGEDGWLLNWKLLVVAGGDGDPRGDAGTAPNTHQLHNWWLVARADGVELSGIGELVSCYDGLPSAWGCESGPTTLGGLVTVTLAALDPDELVPSVPGITLASYPLTYGRLAEAMLTTFISRQDVLDAGGTVNVTNCFATVPGEPDAAEFAPLDLAGAPNLGGLAEPLANNCRQRTLYAGDPEERMTGLGKYYDPGRWNVFESVVAGERFDGVVVMANYNEDGGKALDGVILCDKFDNATQEYVTRLPGTPLTSRHEVAGVQVDVMGGDLARPDREVGIDSVAQMFAVEFATGPWGRATPPGLDRGQAWYAQATSACEDDTPVGGMGWVTESQVDMTNSGQRALNAADVNMIRLRVLVPLPAGLSVRARFPLRALPNPPGTFLINYGTGRTSTPPATAWGLEACFGAANNRCPDPPSLLAESWDPGPFGDAMVLVEAPTSIIVRVAGDDRRTTIRAGSNAIVRLEARVQRRGEWPLQSERRAANVTITDVLPSGLTYVPGSAVVESEDRNGNGRLDGNEDTNGNGVLDPEVALAPAIAVDQPRAGQTTLAWRIGSVVSGREPRVVRFSATVDSLIPGGRTLFTVAGIGDATEPSVDCEGVGLRRTPDRCDYGSFQVANTSRAAVDIAAEPNWVPPGAPVRFQLRAANLTGAPIEWLDATSLLPWVGDPRTPTSSFEGRWAAITATVPAGTSPIEVWASARAPEALDAADGPTPDGALDPVTAYGGPGAGLGDADWPCRLASVADGTCSAIPTVAAVTALRFWGLDPDPNARGTVATSRLPLGAPPLEIELALLPERAEEGDLFHNAWGGRFHGLDLPAFAGTSARIGTPTRLFLPIAMARACEASARAIALVIDASTSMQRQSGLGGTKMAAVQDAALRLIAATLDHGDSVQRLAVVGFNDRAWVAQSITDDRAALEAALGALVQAVAPGTRIDLGLAAGHEALRGAAAGEAVLILLTDGLPTGVPESAVLAAAEAVRAGGIRILTVGYGRIDAPDPADRIDPALLTAIAGPRGRSWVTPDAVALAGVFDAIASELACPVAARWR